jgi:ribulose-phosphate 3-epimerase
MNLLDSSFLCLDLGASGVRALGVRVRAGRVSQSVLKACESPDTAWALKNAVDELEREIGRRFDSAFVTGDFGFVESRIISRTTDWGREHKVAPSDIQKQISDALSQLRDSDSIPLHIIPLRYDLAGFRNIATPIGQIDRALSSAYHVISYSREDLKAAQGALRSAHIESSGMLDPMFLVSQTAGKRGGSSIFIDFGAAWTGVAVRTPRGPAFVSKIPMGQKRLTEALAEKFGITFDDAERIKKESLSAVQSEMDRFAVADAKCELSRADVSEVCLPVLHEITAAAADALRRHADACDPSELCIFGGGANIPGMEPFCQEAFSLPVRNLTADAAVWACARHVWCGESANVEKYAARSGAWRGVAGGLAKAFARRPRREKPRFIPIMPSTLSFNMRSPQTYRLFQSAGISMIHCDIMDGFYVDRITGSMEELRHIREHAGKAHLHVHLMTENPAVWVPQAADAGADTIIISTGTNGVRAALKRIRELGRRAGIALHPDAPLEVLKPVLKDIDEVLVMSVRPGGGGQKFMNDAQYRISTLANTRKKYGLCFKISVDGGINADTAKMCWDAGADFLVSGSYLANAADFPLAVLSLMRD